MASRKKRKFNTDPTIARNSVRYEHGWALKTLAKKHATTDLYFHLGMMHMRCQQYSKALDDFHTALVTMAPGDDHLLTELNYMISYTELLLAGRGEDSGTSLEATARRLRSSTERNPGYIPAWNMLGLLHMMHPSLPMGDETKEGEADKAVSFFTKLLSKFPDCVDVVNNLGVAHILSGDFEMAARCFQTILHKCPKHLEAMNNYGVVLHAQGSDKEAQDMIAAALSVDDKPFYVWTNCAALLKHTRRHASASHALTRAQSEAEPKTMLRRRRNNLRRLTPAVSIVHGDEDSSMSKSKLWAASSYKRLSVDNFATTGMLHTKYSLAGLHPASSPSKDTGMKFGVRTKGTKDIHTLLAIGNNERLLHMRATNKADSSRHLSRALKVLVKAQEVDPFDWRVLNQLGMLKMASGSWEDAVQLFGEALENASSEHDDVGARSLTVNLATSLTLAGEHDRAETLLNEWLKTHTQSHLAHNAMGNLNTAMGKYDDALKSYDRCVAIQPDYGDAYNNMALVHLRLGANERAKECFEEALKISPGIQSAKTNLRRLKQYMGEQEG